jgi:hypothetical protein
VSAQLRAEPLVRPRSPILPADPARAQTMGQHVAVRSRHRWSAPGRRIWPLAVALGLVAGLLRATGLQRANDLFIDEITYAGFAGDVADGRLPNEWGIPFFLHPPGSFLLNGLVTRGFGLAGDDMELALQLRWVSALLGTVGVVLAFGIAARISTRPIAVIAATVLAADPFVLRYDGRLMIETAAMTAVLAGLLLLLMATGRPPSRARTACECGAGLALGWALLNKDMIAVVVIVPLLAAIGWRATVGARTAGRVATAAAVPYLLYLVVLGFAGRLLQWREAKVGGLLRMIGIEQTTGFNAAPGASLAERLIELVTRFGTSYLLLGLCVFAGAAAALSHRPDRRLLGLVAVSTGALGLYAVAGGAAEEQFGYYVIVSSVLALAAVAAELLERRPRFTAPVAGLAAVLVVATLTLGIGSRLLADDGYVQARAWLETSVPAGSNVGLTNVTGEFALLPHPHYGVWPSLTSLGERDADYVLTQSHPLSQGYGYAAPQLLDWLAAHARPAFVFRGPSNGDTVVWRLDRAAVDTAVARGDRIPPVTGDFR